MPYYDTYEWGKNKLWVSPAGWRRYFATRKLPYPVGGVDFMMYFETREDDIQKVEYQWVIKKKDNVRKASS